jgi:hypothetical protein
VRGANSLAARLLWRYEITMSIDGAKKSKGRPKVDSEAVNVRMEREMIACVDEYRRSQPDLPSRPEAIRRLVDDGLRMNDPEIKAALEQAAFRRDVRE